MKLIVGLGNPGSEYERTRHNAGFMAVDRAARRFAPGGVVRSKFNAALLDATIGGERCVLCKPLGFMNRSGESVAQTLNFYKMSAQADLLVLVDEWQLPLGAIRIREGGGDGGHNGLTDVERALGTQAYPRLRIGIEQPPPGYENPADWVLGRFTDEQAKALEPALDKAVEAVECFVTKGLATAMNRFNTKPAPASPPAPVKPPGESASRPSSPPPQPGKPPDRGTIT